MEEQTVRKRVLEQIAQDKAERAQKLNPTGSNVQSKLPQSDHVQPSFAFQPSDNTIAKIQFKKPDGEAEVQSFSSSETFSVVRTFVEENVIVGSGIREFALATTFPKKEFKAEDNDKTLLELKLAPTAVILILPLDKIASRVLPIGNGVGLFAMLSTILWGILNPVFGGLTYVKGFITSRFNNTGAQKRANENELNPNDA